MGRTLTFTPTTVCRYGTATTVHTATITCLWYSVFGSRPVRIVLLHEPGHHGYQLVLVSTDTTADPARIIQRYAARWSIEAAIEDAKQLFGVGQARNRLAAAVRRTVLFALTAHSLTMLWGMPPPGITPPTPPTTANAPPGTRARRSPRPPT